ncbi:MAG TPA: sulfite exporter TauE/SafE family protein, partial [Rhodocyclaceae bacterium]|nr:sulfite exporter TauE/SafE family protein [Rhodocyclaceae bacterium]
PYTRRFLPVRGIGQAWPLGLLWGWLPCGLVYSALATALASGSATAGGLAMLAFGLGTLPNLLLAGLLAARLQRFTRRPAVRIVSGVLVMACGLYGLWAMRTLISQVSGIAT